MTKITGKKDLIHCNVKDAGTASRPKITQRRQLED